MFFSKVKIYIVGQKDEAEKQQIEIIPFPEAFPLKIGLVADVLFVDVVLENV